MPSIIKYFNDVRLENNNVHLASNRKKHVSCYRETNSQVWYKVSNHGTIKSSAWLRYNIKL